MTDVECIHPDCEQTFTTKGGMRVHSVQVHSATPVQWIECEWCDQKFTANTRSKIPRFCSRKCSGRSRRAMQRARLKS